MGTRTGSAARAEIEALTGIRFLAALYVMLHHMSWNHVQPLAPGAAPAFWRVVGNGWLGVDLFFVLSGFILAYNYFDEFRAFRWGTYRSFLWKRLARIYPVHVFTLAVLLAFVAAVFYSGRVTPTPEMFSPATLAPNLLLVQAWAVPLPLNWVNVSWSVSAEWSAYLLFPLVVLAAAAVRTRRHAWAAIVALCVGLVATAVALQLTLPAYFGNARSLGMVRIAFEFPLGVLLYLLFASDARAPRTSARKTFDGALFCVGLAATVLLPVSYLWAVPFFAWTIHELAANRCVAGRLLRHPLLVYGGKISYCLYLVHNVLILVLRHTLPPTAFADHRPAVRLAYIAGYAALALLLSAATYHAVERPSRRWLLRKRGARPGSGGEAESASSAAR